MTSKLLAPGAAQRFEAQSGARYAADQTGVVSNVAAADVLDHLNAGCRFAYTGAQYLSLGTPAVAAASSIVTNGTLSNGSLTIAGQPDVPRKLQAVVAPGAAAISAGSLTLTYTDASGQAQADSFALTTPASTNLTFSTSHGVARIASAVVSGIAGGSSPTIAVGTTNALGLPAVQGAFSFAVFKEVKDGADETVGTVDATGGTVTPTTAPNGTHSFSFGYTFVFG
jgi:hypothetical protein